MIVTISNDSGSAGNCGKPHTLANFGHDKPEVRLKRLFRLAHRRNQRRKNDRAHLRQWIGRMCQMARAPAGGQFPVVASVFGAEASVRGRLLKRESIRESNAVESPLSARRGRKRAAGEKFVLATQLSVHLAQQQRRWRIQRIAAIIFRRHV